MLHKTVNPPFEKSRREDFVLHNALLYLFAKLKFTTLVYLSYFQVYIFPINAYFSWINLFRTLALIFSLHMNDMKRSLNYQFPTLLQE